MDRTEFEAAVLALKDTLYRLSCGYLKGEHDRLGAISETVLKAWMIPMEAPEQTAPDPDPFEHKGFRQAMNQLPEHLRVALMLHYMEGIEVKEIARLMRVSRGAVCSRLKCGRDKLRIILLQEDI